MKRVALVSVAICVALGLVAGAAFAGKNIKTKVTVANPEFGVYRGQVSAKDPCKEGRRVAVWHDTNGNGQVDGDPPDFEIGSTKTGADGSYTVEGNQAPPGDNIIAVVDGAKRDKKRCKPAEAVGQADPPLPF